jgi:hypothetical protein
VPNKLEDKRKNSTPNLELKRAPRKEVVRTEKAESCLTLTGVGSIKSMTGTTATWMMEHGMSKIAQTTKSARKDALLTESPKMIGLKSTESKPKAVQSNSTSRLEATSDHVCIL